MTIGIDIRVLARGARTGVEEYTRSLLFHLFSLAPEINFKLFNATWRKPQIEAGFFDFKNVSLIDFRIPNRAMFFTSRYFNQPKIDRLIGGVDVYFNPHFFPAPASGRAKKVITFHDLSFEHYPEFFSLKKRLWQKFLMAPKKEAILADTIIADSCSTKNDLINLYRIDEEKIKVIYPGVGIKNNGICQKSDSDVKSVKARYRLPDEFVLYFGTIEPRKNLVGLIRAFDLIKEKKEFGNLKLVMAGAKGWLCEEIFKEAKKAKFKRDLIFTGFVQEKDKPYLYKLAKVFVYPSFFEGFGFPPLEAMTCGIPTIVSYASSLPEVVGKGAIMIDPYNIDEMAWAIKEVLIDSSLREQLAKTGLEQAQKFSWDKCAQETLSILTLTK